MRSSNEFSKQKSGFTLIELMIVIIIIGILAGLAIPRFIRTAEKAKGDEAVVNLRLIFTGERMYRLDYNHYGPTLADGGGLCPDYIEIPTSAYFDFNLTPAGPADFSAYTATATRKGSGIYGGKTLTINQDEAWSGDWPPEWIP